MAGHAVPLRSVANDPTIRTLIGLCALCCEMLFPLSNSCLGRTDSTRRRPYCDLQRRRDGRLRKCPMRALLLGCGRSRPRALRKGRCCLMLACQCGFIPTASHLDRNQAEFHKATFSNTQFGGCK